MSSYHQIFVRSQRPESELVADVAAASGAAMDEVGGAEVAYAGKRDRTVVEIELSHDFEDDNEIPMSQYPIVVTVRDLDNNRDRQENAARAILDKLRASQKYRLLLVFDLSVLLGRG